MVYKAEALGANLERMYIWSFILAVTVHSQVSCMEVFLYLLTIHFSDRCLKPGNYSQRHYY